MLAADVVGKVNSAHPGQSLSILRVVDEHTNDRPAHGGMAPAAHLLFSSFRGELSSRIYRGPLPFLTLPDY